MLGRTKVSFRDDLMGRPAKLQRVISDGGEPRPLAADWR